MGFKRHFGDFLQRLIFKFVTAVTLPKGCAYIGSSASAEVVDVRHCSASCRVIGFDWLVLFSLQKAREQTHRATTNSVVGIRWWGFDLCSIPSQIRHSDTSCSSSHLRLLMARLVGKDGGVVTISSECGMLVCNGQILCFPCPIWAILFGDWLKCGLSVQRVVVLTLFGTSFLHESLRLGFRDSFLDGLWEW